MFESQVLKPVEDPNLPEDDWPLLELSNVSIVIHHRGTGTPDELVDVFDISELGPFRVQGKLKLPKKYKKLGRDMKLALRIPSTDL